MKKNSLIAIVVVVVALAIVGFVAMNGKDADNAPTPNTASQTPAIDDQPSEESTAAGQSTQQPSGNEAVISAGVSISNSSFQPQKVTVKKGGTVTWTNKDSLRHDVHPDNPTDEFKQSDLLDKGETYKVTYNTVGTYTYFCTPHPFMKGTVEVVE